MEDVLADLLRKFGFTPLGVQVVGAPGADGFVTVASVCRNRAGELTIFAAQVGMMPDGIGVDPFREVDLSDYQAPGMRELAQIVVDQVPYDGSVTDVEAGVASVLSGIPNRIFEWARDVIITSDGGSPTMMALDMGHTISQVSDSLGLSDRTVKRMVQDGRLPSLKIGSRVVILDRHLEHLYTEMAKLPDSAD